MKKTRKAGAVFVLCYVCLAALTFRAYHVGYRLNISPSVPMGIWKVGPEKEDYEKNDYVLVSPSGHPGYRLAAERRYLIDSMPMLKRVVATEGDAVSYDIREKAVTVNGDYIFMTEILSMDTQGRPLPSASFPTRLRTGEAWLSSENIRGYDSRYFGPVSQDILRGVIPIWKF
jgi:conjugative transfer signal peptidase TraF